MLFFCGLLGADLFDQLLVELANRSFGGVAATQNVPGGQGSHKAAGNPHQHATIEEKWRAANLGLFAVDPGLFRGFEDQVAGGFLGHKVDGKILPVGQQSDQPVRRGSVDLREVVPGLLRILIAGGAFRDGTLVEFVGHHAQHVEQHSDVTRNLGVAFGRNDGDGRQFVTHAFFSFSR